MNDIKPIIDACLKYVNGFDTYKPSNAPIYMFRSELAFYSFQAYIKPEFWDKYVQMAIEVARKSHDVDELILNARKIKVPKEWISKDIYI